MQGCAGKPLGLRATLTKGESRGTCRGPALEPPAGGAQSLSSHPRATVSRLGLCQHGGPPVSASIPLLKFALSSSCLWVLSCSPPPRPRHQCGPPLPHLRPQPLLPVVPQVVCAKCSDYRAELRYDGNRPNRVCLHCFTFLTGNVLPENKEDKRRGILEVRAEGLPSAKVCRRPPHAGPALGAERPASCGPTSHPSLCPRPRGGAGRRPHVPAERSSQVSRRFPSTDLCPLSSLPHSLLMPSGPTRPHSPLPSQAPVLFPGAIHRW